MRFGDLIIVSRRAAAAASASGEFGRSHIQSRPRIGIKNAWPRGRKPRARARETRHVLSVSVTRGACAQSAREPDNIMAASPKQIKHAAGDALYCRELQ